MLQNNHSCGVLAMGEPVLQRVGKLHKQKRQQSYDRESTRGGIYQCYISSNDNSNRVQIVLGETSKSTYGGKIIFSIRAKVKLDTSMRNSNGS